MKAYIKTFGCKVNQYEGQLLSESLEHSGAQMLDSAAGADICIINSCTVTHNADADCRQAVRRCIRGNPSTRVIVTGCLAVSSPGEIRKISPKAEVCADKKAIPGLCGISSPPAGCITYFKGHSKAFLKIQDGCDAFCSYCIVPLVRPVLSCKPRTEVLNEAGALLDSGHSELVLCGIRLGKYESPGEKGYGLTEVIRDILKIDGRIRIGLSSLEMTVIDDEFIDLLRSEPRINRQLHIPLQSGDREVLKLMRRQYTPEEFSGKLKKLFSRLPGLEVTTDVITGFPGETDAMFRNTLEFIKKHGFSRLHVFRYSPRKGTSSGRQTCSSAELKERAETLRKAV